MAPKSLEVVMTELEHMKNSVNEIKTDLKDFIKSADSKYSTKEEHKNNSEKIARIENAILWLAAIMVTAVLGTIMNTVLK